MGGVAGVSQRKNGVPATGDWSIAGPGLWHPANGNNSDAASVKRRIGSDMGAMVRAGGAGPGGRSARGRALGPRGPVVGGGLNGHDLEVNEVGPVGDPGFERFA